MEYRTNRKSLMLLSNVLPEKKTKKAGALIGHIDIFVDGALKGWVVDQENLNANVHIDVVLDGEIVGSGKTCVFREDLRDIGYGKGYHGFHITLNKKLYFGKYNTLELREHKLNLSIKTNVFTLAAPHVTRAELTSSTLSSVSGKLTLGELTDTSVLVTLASKDGTELTGSSDCEGERKGGVYEFSISTSNLEKCELNEFSLVAHGSSTEYPMNLFHYSFEVHEHVEWLREIFFAPFYLYKNNIIGVSIDDAFDHYLTVGIYQDCDPNPWIDSSYIRKNNVLTRNDIPVIIYHKAEYSDDVPASRLFAPKLYRAANSDIGFMSPLIHLCKFGIGQNRPLEPIVYSDRVLAEIKDTSEYEPDIKFCSNVIVHKCPNYHKGTFLPEILTKRVGCDTSVLVCVPFLSIGGADYIATRITTVIAQGVDPSNITVLVTDTNNMGGAHWLERGVNLVVLEEIVSGLPIDTKAAILHKVIANICPEKIVNVNSSVCWKIYRDYGQYLTQFLEMYAYIFCFDYDQYNKPVGYVPEYLEDTIKYLSAVVSDNQAFIDQIFEIYGYPEKYRKRFHCVYTPFENSLPEWPVACKGEKVLWCGRLGRQKNIELLVNISALLPDIEFDVFGPPGDSKYSSRIVNGEFTNLTYRGVYTDITDLNLSDYGAYLYTTNWDGLPVVLINMMASGIPIVSSKVGGIGELLTPANSFPISEDADISEYVRALLGLLYNSSDVSLLTETGLRDVQLANSFEKYCQDIKEIIFVDAGELSGGFVKRDEDDMNLLEAV